MHTKEEIVNQFSTWEQVSFIHEQNQELIDEIVDYAAKNEVIVVFTGAGTSGYIGDYLETTLNQGRKEIKYLSYYSTNIVANPELYLANKCIVLVSFARSGNSPESVEAVTLANKYANEVMHLVITCNKNGALAKDNSESVILLPEITNDKGFAMTNSYSTMLLVAAKIFGINLDLKSIVSNARSLYEEFDYSQITNCEFENIVILSDGQYVGLLNELKLKFMELTNGRLGYYSDQYLNFRHGPKSVITKKTMIIMILSGDEVQSKYQQDLINEFINDENQPYVVTFATDGIEREILTNYKIRANGFELGIVLIPTLQRSALELSLKMGFNPDNPSPCGSVNRVVQGVTIHKR